MHPTTLLTPRSRYVPPTKCRLFDPAYRACAAVTRRSISSCDRHGTAGRVTVPPPLRSRISATSEFPATSAFQQRIDFPAAGPILASTQDGGKLGNYGDSAGAEIGVSQFTAPGDLRAHRLDSQRGGDRHPERQRGGSFRTGRPYRTAGSHRRVCCRLRSQSVWRQL